MDKVSFVIPVYNEEENVRILFNEIKSVMKKTKYDYEVIFVDDGSTDNTLKNLRSLSRSEKNLQIIPFRRNFGKTSAMSAALDNIKGKYIITMDGDLQNDPRDVPRILKELKDHDVVSGWRRNRKDPFTKRCPSRAFNWLARKMTGVKVHDFDCMLKGYRSEVLKDLKIYGDMHRYMLPLVSMRGFTISEIEVNHRKRKHGRSKFGFGRIVRGMLDLFYIKFWLDFSTRPLHLFGTLGAFLLGVGTIISIYKIFYQFLWLGQEFIVTPLFMLAVLFLILGIMFISFGFLGEIMIRTYYETTGKKPYELKK